MLSYTSNHAKYILATTMHYISNSGMDENGGYSGGTAGDQTGTEWQIRSWYSYPWSVVLRHPDQRVGLLLAILSIDAALNDKIGYDQSQRQTYFNKLKAANWEPSKITAACESDCSAGVCAHVAAVGHILNMPKLQNHTGTYTGNMRSALIEAGFSALTGSKYIASGNYLLPGDILLNDVNHTATNVTVGISVRGDWNPGTTPYIVEPVVNTKTFSNSPLVSYVRYSPNHSGARTHAIDRITPHCVVGQCSVETLGEIFAPTSREASSNYGIGSDGRIGMYVEEKNRSWCSSSNANDQRAVTIECASDAYAPYAFKDIVYKRLIELCTDICKRYGKKKLIWIADKDKALSYTPAADEMLLTAHRWFAITGCPGDWMYSRESLLAAAVTANLIGTSNTPSTNTLKFKKGDRVKFTGNIHYASADALKGPAATPCEAEVTAISVTGKHPYHLVGKSVYGWVDAKYVSATTAKGTIKTTTAVPAMYKNASYRGTYKVNALDGLNMRAAPGTNNTAIVNIPNNSEVQCYGYYGTSGTTKWLYVVYKNNTGYCSSDYLVKQ